MLRIVDEHTPLLGKLAKLTEFGVLLEQEYYDLFKVGNPYVAENIHYYCNIGGRYEMKLIFIDEKPIKNNELTFFCLKEIGTGVSGDYHWFTLNQLMICE